MKVFALVVLLGFVAAVAASSSDPYQGFVNDNSPHRTPGPISLALSAALSELITSGEYDELFTAQYGDEFELPAQGHPKKNSFSDRCGHNVWPSASNDEDEYGRGGSKDHSFKHPFTLQRALGRATIRFAIPAAAAKPSLKPIRSGFYYNFALALTRKVEAHYGVPLNPECWEVPGNFFLESSRSLYRIDGYDAALGDIIITNKGKKAVDFTCPYATFELAGLRTGLEPDLELDDEDDLNDPAVTIAVESSELAAQRAQEIFPLANIISLPTGSLSQFAIDNLAHVVFTDSNNANSILATGSCGDCYILEFDYPGTTRYYYAISTPRYFAVNN